MSEYHLYHHIDILLLRNSTLHTLKENCFLLGSDYQLKFTIFLSSSRRINSFILSSLIFKHSFSKSILFSISNFLLKLVQDDIYKFTLLS